MRSVIQLVVLPNLGPLEGHGVLPCRMVFWISAFPMADLRIQFLGSPKLLTMCLSTFQIPHFAAAVSIHLILVGLCLQREEKSLSCYSDEFCLGGNKSRGLCSTYPVSWKGVKSIWSQEVFAVQYLEITLIWGDCLEIEIPFFWGWEASQFGRSQIKYGAYLRPHSESFTFII